MDDKEVVENNSDYVIEFKDKYKGKFHYSKKGEWILEKINKEPNKLCINNYALNNDPVFTAVISGNFIFSGLALISNYRKKHTRRNKIEKLYWSILQSKVFILLSFMATK